ncbi:membrane protein [Alphaproteobacteria bacterium]|nr:membrane protein [Alphaproteobacteria bacterium]
MGKKDIKKNGCCRGSRHIGWRVFIGMLFLLAAAAVVCSALNIITLGINVGWLLLTILLAAIAVAGLVKLNWFGLFMATAGIVTVVSTQTDYLPQLDGHIGTLWIVAVLVSIGFSILFHRRHSWYKSFHGERKGDKYETVIDAVDDTEINVDVNFSSTIKYINSNDFRRARLDCNFGSITVYFDNAAIKGDSAVIDIDSSFSGLELYVPKEWNIIDDLSKTGAGISFKNNRRGYDKKDEKTVTLTGNLNLSGIEIVYI